MRIDIWSDIVCPFCYVGKRNLELALAEFEHRDEVDVVWHSFELDPSATEHPAGRWRSVPARSVWISIGGRHATVTPLMRTV